MKGCLKIFVIILIVSVIAGVLVCGTCYFVGNNLKKDFTQQVEDKNPVTMEQRAMSIAEYQLPDGYSLEKSFDIFSFKLAVFKYNPKKQVLLLAEPPGWLIRVNETNFKDALTPQEIERAMQQSQSKSVKIRDLKILEEGKVQTATREVPYVMARVVLEDTRTGKSTEFEGAVSVMTFSNNAKNVVVLSGNLPGKFDFIAMKEFIKTIKVN